MKAVILMPLMLSTGLAGISGQSDWQYGPGVPGPVSSWGRYFDTHQYMDYEGTVGELYLNLKGEKFVVTDEMEYSLPGMVADINGDTGYVDTGESLVQEWREIGPVALDEIMGSSWGDDPVRKFWIGFGGGNIPRSVRMGWVRLTE